AGGEQSGPAGEAAEEEVGRHLGAPRGRLDDAPPVIGGELRIGHDGHLPRAVSPAAGPTRPAAALAGAPPSRRLGRPEAVELGGGHRRPRANARPAAAIIPSAAIPARENIRGRSAVGTRGSGGRPYASGSSSSRNTEPVPPTPSRSFAP